MGTFQSVVAWGVVKTMRLGGTTQGGGGKANFGIAETACGAAAVDRRNYFRSC